jgi:beta-glucuronidase
MEESGMAGRWQRWGGVAILALCMAGQVFAATRVDLDGTGWTFRTTLEENAADVTVPHCWPASERYRRYIGIGTYEHDFDAPAAGTGKVVRLRFDAVYEQASVWLNGRRLGAHQGGYTPFEFDVTKLLKPGKNHLLVEVNNTPTVSTIPAIATSHGSREYPAYGAAAGDGIVGWMPYGGIVRPVSLLITDAVYLRNMKIDTKPDLARHSASITVHAWIHNSGANAAITAVRGTIAGLPVTFPRVKVAGSSDAVITWSGNLKDAHLWSVRDPFLYDASLHVAGDKLDAKIGVREIRVQGTELLLNGQPVHLFGANRVSEDAKEGLRESDAIVERDMSDMLADNMRMMRIAHYPQAPALLDFADKHGMLIIAEAGNWNMGAWQMADPEIRATWQKQMKEMMEQDWNHPSVIAWSVGIVHEGRHRLDTRHAHFHAGHRPDAADHLCFAIYRRSIREDRSRRGQPVLRLRLREYLWKLCESFRPCACPLSGQAGICD